MIIRPHAEGQRGYSFPLTITPWKGAYTRDGHILLSKAEHALLKCQGVRSVYCLNGDVLRILELYTDPFRSSSEGTWGPCNLVFD